MYYCTVIQLHNLRKYPLRYFDDWIAYFLDKQVFNAIKQIPSSEEELPPFM